MENKFETPAVIELFGHSKIAGLVQEQSIGGASFIRVDVPETKENPAFSRLLHPNAIYAINPVSDEIMRTVAEGISFKPIKPYEIKDLQKQISSTSMDDSDPFFD